MPNDSPVRLFLPVPACPEPSPAVPADSPTPAYDGVVVADLRGVAEPGVLTDLSASADVVPYRFDRKGAARYLSISPRSLDYLIAGGRLKTLRDGKKVMILRTELERYGRGDHPLPMRQV